jgi:hypothetical protein
MQVSEGLKRATGRGEQVQHHLGTLNFDSHSALSMASTPKLSRFTTTRLPAPAGAPVGSPEKPEEAANLDFAANPNHYRANRVGKAKPGVSRAMDLSPRLVLALSLECETTQMPDPDFEE